MILLSFAVMILTGAVLLSLPFASKSGQSVGFLDALFTATSANCVTGLVVVNTREHWTLFGQIVILALIQVGALGLISIMTLIMVVTRRSITLNNRLMIQMSFNQEKVAGMVRFVKKIASLTFIIEGIGAVLLTFGFYFSSDLRFGQALYYGIFHAISAFCNAGFDIIGPASLEPYVGNVFINFVIMALIISGGLGFVVWIDIITRLRKFARHPIKQELRRLALHSKMAILITVALIVLGTVLFLVFEWSNEKTLGHMGVGGKLLAALFQSVTLRTAGFNSIPQGGLTEASQFVSGIWMMIGGSPASAAGGFKTVSLGIVLFTVISAARGRRNVEAFHRTIPQDQLQKVLTVISTFLGLVLIATIILSISERRVEFPHSFLDLFFEAASAAGTVGVSTGITPHLTVIGRLVIIFSMYMGRLGPIAVVIGLNIRMHTTNNELTYPEERVTIG